MKKKDIIKGGRGSPPVREKLRPGSDARGRRCGKEIRNPKGGRALT